VIVRTDVASEEAEVAGISRRIVDGVVVQNSGRM
jgi:hypothetical protein